MSCTKPNCNCIEKEAERTGVPADQLKRGYPCLAPSEDVGMKKKQPANMDNTKEGEKKAIDLEVLAQKALEEYRGKNMAFWKPDKENDAFWKEVWKMGYMKAKGFVITILLLLALSASAQSFEAPKMKKLSKAPSVYDACYKKASHFQNIKRYTLYRDRRRKDHTKSKHHGKTTKVI